MNNIKNIKHKLWSTRKAIYNSSKNILWSIRRRIRVSSRRISPSRKEGYLIAILCIKKTVYADLSIKQANSLHYFNPSHIFTIWTDDVCGIYLENNINKFDYPEKILIKKSFGNATKPWTYYKIEMRIANALAGGLDIDADTIWHDDLVIDKSKIYMLAAAFVFNENPIQKDMILKLFKKPEWLSYTHFISAFVHIPQALMTDKLASDARSYVSTMLNDPLDFIPNKSDKDEIRRISEEIAICFALQSNYPGQTMPLKKDGSKKDKVMLEPVYYGSENRVII